MSSSAFQYRFSCESEIFSACCSASSVTGACLAGCLTGTSTTWGSGSTSSLCTLPTTSARSASEIFDIAFFVEASGAEGFVTRADFELKERVDCAAAFRVAADVLPLLRRPGGIVGIATLESVGLCTLDGHRGVVVAEKGCRFCGSRMLKNK